MEPGAALNQGLRQFVDDSAWGTASCELLSGDASPRKYFRLRMHSGTVVLMDASQDIESVAPFIHINRHLQQLGFSVPRILSRNEAEGLLLLEDFGDDSFTRLLLNPDNAERLFALAVDVLSALHRHPAAIPRGLRKYSPEKMLADLELFLEWRTPAASASAKSEFRSLWSDILPMAHEVPSSLLLRDYHVANLLLLRNREGVCQVGLLDFQDAYEGPITYDLASLLEDARRDVPPELRTRMLARFFSHSPELDRAACSLSLAILAAQRHTRVLGIFERLSRRDGKHEYKELHSPRVESLLHQALSHPALAQLQNWMERARRSKATTHPAAPLISKAMVLAAGHGTRLKPLTDQTPKPLVPVAGKPMLEYALDKLRAHGIRDVVINVSHLKEQLIHYAADIPGLKVKISEESQPLETGGGIKHALPLLGSSPFFTINSDIIWLDETDPLPCRGADGPRPQQSPAESEATDFQHVSFGQRAASRDGSRSGPPEPAGALARLAHHWDADKMNILLLVQPRAKAVGYDQGEDQLFIKPGNTIGWSEHDAPYIIAGVGIIHPRVFADSPAGKFSIKTLWLQALSQNRLFCLPHLGPWFQTGTVKDIQEAEKYLRAIPGRPPEASV